MKIRALCAGALMCGCLALGACATPAGQFARQPADTLGQPTAAQASNSPAGTGPAASQAVQPQPTADDFVPEKIIDASRVSIPQSFIDEAVANVAAYQNRSIQGVPYAPVPLEEMTQNELWRVQEMTWLRAFGKGTVTEWKEEDLDPDSKALIDRCKALQEAQALGDPIPSDSQVDLAGDGRTITVRYENSRSDKDGLVYSSTGWCQIGKQRLENWDSVGVFRVPVSEDQDVLFVKVQLDETSEAYLFWGDDNDLHSVKATAYDSMDFRFPGEGSAILQVENYPVRLLATYKWTQEGLAQRGLRIAFSHVRVLQGLRITVPSADGGTVHFDDSELLTVVAYSGHYVALLKDSGEIGFLFVGNEDSTVSDDSSNLAGGNDYFDLLDHQDNHYRLYECLAGFAWIS